MRKYIHKSHNVSVLLYHLVCPIKYRKAILTYTGGASLIPRGLPRGVSLRKMPFFKSFLKIFCRNIYGLLNNSMNTLESKLNKLLNQSKKPGRQTHRLSALLFPDGKTSSKVRNNLVCYLLINIFFNHDTPP